MYSEYFIINGQGKIISFKDFVSRFIKERSRFYLKRKRVIVVCAFDLYVLERSNIMICYWSKNSFDILFEVKVWLNDVYSTCIL